MIARVYDTFSALWLPLQNSDTLAAACLLADKTEQCGNSTLFIQQQGTFENFKSYLDKFDFMYAVRERNGLNTAWDRSQFKVMRKTLAKRDYRPGVYAITKNFERLTDKYFSICCKMELERNRKLGYDQLYPWYQSGILECFAPDPENPEAPGKNYFARNSGFLHDGFEAGSEGDGRVFLLHPGLPNVSEEPVHSWNDSSGVPGRHSSRLLFCLPIPYLLSESELQLLRHDLRPALGPFRAAMENWVRAFAGPDGTEEAAMAFGKVAAAAAVVNEALEKHPLSAQHAPTWNRMEVHAWTPTLGELWTFLNDNHEIPAESWEVLLQEQRKTAARQRPVLRLRYNGFQHAHEEPVQGQTGSKRSLSID